MQANLELSVVALPAEEDEVIEEQGVRVFLEPEAASLLDAQSPRRELRAEPGLVHDRRPDRRGVAEPQAARSAPCARGRALVQGAFHPVEYENSVFPANRLNRALRTEFSHPTGLRTHAPLVELIVPALGTSLRAT
jgi:hypothetical protein